MDKTPDLLFITEANLWKNTPDELTHIDGYDMVLPDTMNTCGYARIVLLIKPDITYKILHQYMDSWSASIWVQVGTKGRKPTRVGGIYREHHLLGYPTPNPTGTPDRQLERWNTILKGWTAAAAAGNNCLIIGDLNLDYSKWDQPSQGITRMVNRTKLEVETIGFTQLVDRTTRAWEGMDDSTVDHIWTNDADRIIAHDNEVRSGSDHNVVSVVMRTKDRISQKQEILIRSWKDLDKDRVKLKMRLIDWTDIYLTKNIDIANDILETRILNVLNSEAPLKVVQVRKNFRNWVQNSLKEKNEGERWHERESQDHWG